MRLATDRELMDAATSTLGVPRTATVLGWATLWGVQGCRDWRDVLSKGTGSRPTKYAVLRDLRRVKDALEARGLSAGEGEDDRVVLLDRAAHAGSGPPTLGL